MRCVDLVEVDPVPCLSCGLEHINPEVPRKCIRAELDLRSPDPGYGVVRVSGGERFEGQDVQPELRYPEVHRDDDARFDLLYGPVQVLQLDGGRAPP